MDLPPLECSKNTKNLNDQSFLPFDRENDDVNSSSLIDPSQLSLSNKFFDDSSRQLHISWLPRMNMSYYGCDQVKVQCVPEEMEEETNQKEVGPKEVYSKPLKCNNIENNTLINVVRYSIAIIFIFISGELSYFNAFHISLSYFLCFRQSTPQSLLRVIHLRRGIWTTVYHILYA